MRVYRFNEQVMVVASSKQAAEKLYKAQFGSFMSCKIVPKDEDILIEQNPYTGDSTENDEREFTAEEWVERGVWEEGPEMGPWFLDTPEQIETKDDEEDYEEKEDEEEKERESIEETQVALRRKCACDSKTKDSCPLCGGEGTVTVWVDATWDNEGIDDEDDFELTIKKSVVQEAFAHLEAYRVLTQRGFSVGRKMT